MVNHFNAQNFQNEVLNSEKFVLVDFFATWCGPCKMLSPVIDEISEDSELNLPVGKVDIDESEDIAKEFGIMSVPTMILFKGGKEISRITGFVAKEELKEKLKAKMN